MGGLGIPVPSCALFLFKSVPKSWQRMVFQIPLLLFFSSHPSKCFEIAGTGCLLVLAKIHGLLCKIYLNLTFGVRKA